MTVRRWIFSAVAVLGLVIWTASSPPAVASALRSGSQPSQSEGFKHSEPADTVFADRLSMLAPQYAVQFGGVVLGDDGVVQLYTTSPQGSLVRAARELKPAGVGLSVTRVSRSYASLRAKLSAVAAEYPTLRIRFPIVTVSVDVSKNVVDVSVQATGQNAAPARVNAAQAFFDQKLGAGWVSVVATLEGPSTPAGRSNAFAPYPGGDNILLPSPGLLCSAGFAVKSGTKVYLLTAGHCLGGNVYVNNTQLPGGKGNLIGAVSKSYFLNMNTPTDFELITANADGYIFTGPPSLDFTGGVEPVAGITDPAVGTQMNFDGGKTGEVDGALVQNANDCDSVNYGGSIGTQLVCDLGSASDSSEICKGGDSGGPAEVASSGVVQAAGTIVSQQDSGKRCWFQEMGTELGFSNTNIVVAPGY